MKTRGIRILDKIDRAVSVTLQSILEEIYDGDLLYWSILDFYGMGHLGNGKSIPLFEEEVCESEKRSFL